MLALVLTLCLKSDPAQCSDKILAWRPHQTAETCLLETRAQVADFAAANPTLIVHKVACMRKRG